MLTQAMQDIINFIKAVAPIVWETLVKQVYVDAVTYLIWGVVIGITAFVLLKVGKNLLKKAKDEDVYDEEMYQVGAMFSYAFGIILPFVSVAFITTAIRFMINPYYYAVLNIIKLFASKQ